MKLFFLTIPTAIAVAAGGAGAAERIEINNVYPMTQETFELNSDAELCEAQATIQRGVRVVLW